LLRSYRDALEHNAIEELVKSRGAEYLDQVPYEIAELIYLFESLRDFEDQRLKTRFKSAIQGPELLEDDATGSFRDTVPQRFIKSGCKKAQKQIFNGWIGIEG
jgi:hypothetical protein